ncbi:MAG: TraB/GumN family protein, partial [Bacteroidia bacterium]|nr:TraB/GumN family protein [Bacteroidia bacterium]
GNLDLLDSINRYNSFSDAFDEKFLYRRNEIQANSVDSIIKSGSVLFAGVGAAHLPGNRGVIELLRKKGYRLRPVKMGERDSKDKEAVDKIRVPVVFRTETADDGLFKVDIPGKFYKMGDDGALDQQQYADMSNGSYYMVTRIMTNAWMWGDNVDDVYKAIDSLLYENIPGKIISKIPINKNGYRGLDITNRTRRGDLQRYNIFITPFEIIFFKMSGNGDYVKNGKEAGIFFGSIRFKEYKNSADQLAPFWKKYSPPCGGFAVDLPHEPYTGNDGSWIFDSEDKTGNTHYRIIRSDIHNYHFVGEDSFDLSLMDESFKASDFIDTQLWRKPVNYKGYPAMNCKYRDKSGSIFLTRFIIQGPHYYTLIAYGEKETTVMINFLNSFEFKPFVYNEPAFQRDTSLYFEVKTPVFPEDKKIKLGIPRNNIYAYKDDEEDNETESEQLEGGTFRNKIVSNDSTGEKIYVSFYHPSRYNYTKDTTAIDKRNETAIIGDTSWIIRSTKKTEIPNRMKVWETIATDSGSSRTLWTKLFYKDGIRFSLVTETDTLTQPSIFVKNFYETFSPVDTLKGINPFTKKSNLFFSDFLGSNSARHKLAVKHIDDIILDSADFPQLKKAVSSLNWNEKKYLDTKRSLIGRFSDIQTNASADYLKNLYYVDGDTVELQYRALESLLQQQTSYSFNIFKEIINTEPPVLDGNVNNSYFSFRGKKNRFVNGSFLDELSDSLQLAKTILPDLLPLLNLDDYKKSLMQLLAEMIDSNLVKPKDYDMYFSKFLIEAKQELRKQAIAEKKRAIEKAEENKKDSSRDYLTDDDEKDNGNDKLSLYATLLLPYWQTNVGVQRLIQQMVESDDKKLKYSTTLLLIRNNKPFQDSMLTYFASLDDYRYDLYTDLKGLKKLDQFPSLYFNHLDLGRSSLITKKSSDKPDSLLYLDKLKAEVRGEKGFVYFYKYKSKKDDLTWKLALVGLIPEDPKKFEFDTENKNSGRSTDFSLFNTNKNTLYKLTRFTDTRIDNNEPLGLQLNKELKKILYSLHKSGREFYADSDNDDDLSRRFSFGN